MSDPGKFLSRWSRRKREAADAADATTPPAASEPAVENARGAQAPPIDNPAAPSDAPKSTAPTFDLASLPAIESIAADTDIRAFLAPGVPPELTRAALRRAWAADPKIRNFVGLADYDWDFNTPGSMAGFGPLEMTEELRQVVARIIGPAPAADRIEGLDSPSAALRPGQDFNEINAEEHSPSTEQNDKDAGNVQDVPRTIPDQSRDPDELTQCGQEDGAAQHQPKKPESQQSTVRRSHGRALPK
jgi:Protein of unknown function (DUF3306)